MLCHAADVSFFLAEIVRRPVVRPIFNSPTQFTLVFYICIFCTLSRGRIHPTCAWALFHCLPPFSRHRIPLRRAEHALFSIFIHSSKYMAGTTVWGSMDGFYDSESFIFYLLVWFFIFAILFGLRSASLFDSHPFICIFGDFFFLVSGSALGHIASLEGVCWNIRRLCERAQCAAISVISVHAFLIVFFAFFVARPIYLSQFLFCSL